MGEFVAQWYGVLSVLTRTLGEPIRDLAAGSGLPLLSALLFGLIGSLSPCQLTTGMSAVALIGRRPESSRPLLAGLAYAGGKALVYAALGLIVVLLGHAVAQSAIPILQVVRRVLGPLMLIGGLVLLGVLRPRITVTAGERLAAVAADRLDATRPKGAFALGMAFALAFCPTLFFLFFGLTIPLALTSPGGIVFPALFALGTTLPLLIVLGALALGARSSTGITQALHRLQPRLTQFAGVILILAGLNDTVVYWFV